MEPDRQRFLDLCLDAGVLRFGDFTLKSGRRSPYFFNLGKISTGKGLAELGTAYARALEQAGLDYDMLFGPAYKGIALAAATSIGLAGLGRDVPWAYNRKEAKDHGEGGHLVGAPLAGRVVVVDDVITAGTATREALQLIVAGGGTPAGLLVAMDRGEPGPSGRLSAAAGITAEFGIPVIAIAHVDDLLELVAGRVDMAEHHARLREWHDTCFDSNP